MKKNFFDSETISSFFEYLVDSAFKVANSKKLLEEDNILDTLPWGKLIKYFIDKVIVVEDKNEAFQKAVAFSYFKTFYDALKEYKVSLSVDDNYLEIFKRSTLKTYNITEFDFNDFLSNQIISTYQNAYKQLLINDNIEQNIIKKIDNYINNYIKLNFYKILNENRTTFKVLNEFLNTYTFIEYQKIYLRDKYKIIIGSEFTQLVLNDEKGLTLEDIYIEPNFRIHTSALIENDKRLQEEYEIFGRNIEFLDITNRKKTIHDFVDNFINNSIKEYDLKSKSANVLFVLGFPGQGKSSFCKKAIYDIIHNIRPVAKDVYLIKLKKIINVKKLIYNPLDIIRDYLIDETGISLSIKELKSSIIILDGLDELFMKDGLNMSEIDTFCSEIIRSVEDDSEIKIILTSRYGYIDLERISIKRNVLILQLSAFDLSQQITWLNIFKKFHPEVSLSVEDLKDIYPNEEDEENLHDLSHIQELIDQPILLHMVATSNIDIRQKANKAYVYDMLFTKLIDRNWAKEGQIENLLGLEKDHLREIVGDIAIAIFHSDQGFISKNELQNLESVKRITTKLRIKDLANTLKITMIAFYFQEAGGQTDSITIDKDNYGIEFLHKSLQEYMAAEKIWKTFRLFEIEIPVLRKFLINSSEEALKELFNVFSPKLLSSEISNYLLEIINNESSEIKNRIASRLEVFFEELIVRDFFQEYHQDKRVSPIELSLNTFYGFWFVLSNLDTKQNFLTQEIKEKFGFLMGCLTKKNKLKINLSYQDLSGLDLSFSYFHNLNLEYSNLSQTNFSYLYCNGVKFKGSILYRTKFDNSFISMSRYYFSISYKRYFEQDLEGVDFSRNIFSRVDFNNLKMNETAFNNSKLENVSFVNSNLRSSNFYSCYLMDVDFTNAVLDGAMFDNAVFENVNGLTIEQLSKVGSLFNVRGIPTEIHKELQLNFPKLFEDDTPF